MSEDPPHVSSFINREDNNVYEAKEPCQNIHQISNKDSMSKKRAKLKGVEKKTLYLLEEQCFEPKLVSREENVVYEDDGNNKIDQGSSHFPRNTGSSKNPSYIYNPTRGNRYEHFDHHAYDLFNYEKDCCLSDETDVEDSESSSDSCDADNEDDEGSNDETSDREINEDQRESPLIEEMHSLYDSDTSSVSESDLKEFDDSDPNLPPHIDDEVTYEKLEPLVAELFKKPKRVLPKRMMPNPEKADRPPLPKEEPWWKGTELDKDNPIEIPPYDENEQYRPPEDPEDPNYLGPYRDDPNKPWIRWDKELGFSSEEELSSYTNTDFVTASDGNFSTETSIDTEYLTSCPEDEPIYPVIYEEEYERPRRYRPYNNYKYDWEMVPKTNPEVQVWYDHDGNEYLDAKNEKGEWVTVEKVVVEYPPKPKNPAWYSVTPKDTPEPCFPDPPYQYPPKDFQSVCPPGYPGYTGPPVDLGSYGHMDTGDVVNKSNTMVSSETMDPNKVKNVPDHISYPGHDPIEPSTSTAPEEPIPMV